MDLNELVTVNLQFDCESHHFRMYRHRPLSEAAVAFGQQVGLDPTGWRFMHKAQYLDSSLTPDDIGLENGNLFYLLTSGPRTQ